MNTKAFEAEHLVCVPNGYGVCCDAQYQKTLRDAVVHGGRRTKERKQVHATFHWKKKRRDLIRLFFQMKKSF